MIRAYLAGLIRISMVLDESGNLNQYEIFGTVMKSAKGKKYVEISYEGTYLADPNR